MSVVRVVRGRLALGLVLAAQLLVLLACGGGTTAPTASIPTLAPEAAPTTAEQAPTSAPIVTLPSPTTAAAASPTAPSSTGGEATETPPTGGAPALDVIAQAQQAQSTAKSFRSTNQITTATGAQSTVVTEYVAPDRLHSITKAAGGTTIEMIVIKGQGTWQKVGGNWVKSPVDLSSTVFSFLDPKLIEQLKSSINIGQIQFAGLDVLDGKPTIVYTYTTTIKGAGRGGSDLKGTYKIWIGVADHRAYKIEGDTDSLTTAGGKTHSLTTIEYDIPLQIEPPS